MKISTIACAALAGTLGFSSAAFARDGGDRPRRPRKSPSSGRSGAKRGQRWDERRDERRPIAATTVAGARVLRPVRTSRATRRRIPDTSHRARVTHLSRATATATTSPATAAAPRFSRGGYLPHEYRQRAYYVNDWHSHGGARRRTATSG